MSNVFIVISSDDNKKPNDAQLPLDWNKWRPPGYVPAYNTDAVTDKDTNGVDNELKLRENDLAWLYGPDCTTDDEIQRLLQAYAVRDLSPAALYRQAARIWGFAPSRVRRFECGKKEKVRDMVEVREEWVEEDLKLRQLRLRQGQSGLIGAELQTDITSQQQAEQQNKVQNQFKIAENKQQQLVQQQKQNRVQDQLEKKERQSHQLLKQQSLTEQQATKEVHSLHVGSMTQWYDYNPTSKNLPDGSAISDKPSLALKPHPPAYKLSVLQTEPFNQDSVDSRKYIEWRKKLRQCMNSVELSRGWLELKPDKTEVEWNVLDRLRAEQGKAAETLPVGVDLAGVTPAVNLFDIDMIMKSEALRIIEKFLYDRCLRLVDLFQFIDKSKNWRITKQDFIKAIVETGLPLSEAHIDDIMIMMKMITHYDNDNEMTEGIKYKQLARCLALRRDYKISHKRSGKQWEAIIQIDQSRRRMTERLLRRIRRDSEDIESSSSGGRGSIDSDSIDSDEEKSGNNNNNNNDSRVSDGGSCNKVDRTTERNLNNKRGVVSDNNDNSNSPIRNSNSLICSRGSCKAATEPRVRGSTLGGDVGEAVDRFRETVSRVHEQVKHRCQEQKISVSQEAINRGLLHYPDKRDLILNHASSTQANTCSGRHFNHVNVQTVPSTGKHLLAVSALSSIHSATSDQMSLPENSESLKNLITSSMDDIIGSSSSAGFHGTPTSLQQQSRSQDKTKRTNHLNGLVKPATAQICSRPEIGYKTVPKTSEVHVKHVGNVPSRVDCRLTDKELEDLYSKENRIRFLTGKKKRQAAILKRRAMEMGDFSINGGIWVPDNLCDYNTTATPLFHRVAHDYVPRSNRPVYRVGGAWSINEGGYIQTASIERRYY